jgi:hypothetical protein
MSDIIKVEKLVEVYRGGTKAVYNISFTVKSGAREGDCETGSLDWRSRRAAIGLDRRTS